MPFHLGIQKLNSELGTPEDRRHNLSLMAIACVVYAIYPAFRSLEALLALSFVLGLVGVGRAVRPRSRGRRG